MSGKRKGGAEKVREKNKKLLLVVSEKCTKLTDMFGTKNNELEDAVIKQNGKCLKYLISFNFS